MTPTQVALAHVVAERRAEIATGLATAGINDHVYDGSLASDVVMNEVSEQLNVLEAKARNVPSSQVAAPDPILAEYEAERQHVTDARK